MLMEEEDREVCPQATYLLEKHPVEMANHPRNKPLMVRVVPMTKKGRRLVWRRKLYI